MDRRRHGVDLARERDAPADAMGRSTEPRADAQTTRLIGRIRSRWRLRIALDRVAWSLAIAGGASAGLVAASRWLGEAPWAWVAVAGVVAAGVAAGVAIAALADVRPEHAAAAADAHAGLPDTISNAWQLSADAGEDAGFAALAVREAEGRATSVRAAEVAPVRLGRGWLAWPALVAGAFLLAAYLPPWGPSPRVRTVASEEQRQAVQDEVRGLADRVVDLPADDEDPAERARIEEQLERLREIEDELAAGADPAAAATEAASAAAEVADAIEESSQRDLDEDQALRDALSRLERRDTPEPPAEEGSLSELADRLEDALQRGDLQRAAEVAEQLEQSAAADGTAPQPDRDRAAESLRDLADQVERAAQATQDRAGEAPSDPPEAGDTPATPPGDPAEEDAGSSSDEAPRPDRPEGAQDLSDALREAADQIQDPAETPPDGAQPPDQRPDQGSEPAAPRDPGAEPPQSEQSQERSGEQSQQGQQTQQGEQAGERQGAEPSEQASERPAEQPGEQRQGERPGQQTEGGQPDAQQGEQSSETASEGAPQQSPGSQPAGAQQPDPSQADPAQQDPGQPNPDQAAPDETIADQAQDGASQSESPSEPGEAQDASGERPGQQGQQSPSGTPTQRPDASQPSDGAESDQDGEGDQEGQQGEGGGRLSDRLRDLAERPQRAQERQRQAEDLRRRAREAFDRMSPDEQRELLERLREQDQQQDAPADDAGGRPDGGGAAPGGADGDQRSGAPPSATNPWQQEIVDARPEEPGEADAMQTVAEWFGEGRDTPGRPVEGIARDVRRAARGAQDAIEQERVPRRRSELIRRVFRRYAEQFAPAPAEAAPAEGGSR